MRTPVRAGRPQPGPVPWPVDHARARHDAAQTLAAIDWSRRDIVIWVPGTRQHGLPAQFEAAARSAWSDGRLSLLRLQHAASAQLHPGVATGIETLRLVLAGIAAHAGDHRVMLAGQDQGAWIIGEALADPHLTRVVSRAVLFGHPAMATHQYSDGRDARVLVVNHPHDPWSRATATPATTIDALQAALRAGAAGLAGMVRLLVSDPARGAALLHSRMPATGLLRSPTDYDTEMPDAVEFLRHGAPTGGASASRASRRSGD